MPTRSTRAWTIPGMPGLACFRAVNLVHEYSHHGHSTCAIGIVDDGTGGIWSCGAGKRGGHGELITISPGEGHAGYLFSAPHQLLDVQAPHRHDSRCICGRSLPFKTGTDAAESMRAAVGGR